MQQLRIEISTETKRYQKVLVLPEETYADDAIQEVEVLEAFRELREAVKQDTDPKVL